MCVLQDGFSGGFPGSMSTACVHSDQQRLGLPGSAAHAMLESGHVLQSVQRNHTVIVISRQQ